MISDKKAITVLGLMSGTSMDGIDSSLIKTDGKNIFKQYPALNNKYSKATQTLLFKAFSQLDGFLNNKDSHEELIYNITIDHYKTAKNLINKTNIIPELIGFHGQTIYHNASQKKSIQLGNSALLSKLLKIDVISDFRKNDLEQGGEGAPLAPVFHKCLIKKHKFQLPACFLNIGGIANISYYDGATLIGFDVGPGNGLMDQFIQSIFPKKKYDKNGKIASQGVVNNYLVKKFMCHPFFVQNFPKSLDRQDFSELYNSIISTNLSLEDKMSTLAELTIQGIKKSIDLLPSKPQKIIVVGGGAKNKYLISSLKKIFQKNFYTYNELGFSSQRVEADLIAYITARSKYNYPISYPKTTGASKPSPGGKLYKFL